MCLLCIHFHIVLRIIILLTSPIDLVDLCLQLLMPLMVILSSWFPHSFSTVPRLLRLFFFFWVISLSHSSTNTLSTTFTCSSFPSLPPFGPSEWVNLDSWLLKDEPSSLSSSRNEAKDQSSIFIHETKMLILICWGIGIFMYKWLFGSSSWLENIQINQGRRQLLGGRRLGVGLPSLPRCPWR